MSFIIGKLARKVSKQHKEYFVGRINAMPVRGAWAKNGQDELCVFLDMEQVNFLSEKNKTKPEPGPAAQTEDKQ